jgi:putative DNA primase/helicase
MQFADFLHSVGLEPREIVPGRWLRCKTVNHPRKKNGSFKLAEDGRIGWAIDYAIHAEHQVWHADGDQTIRVDHAAIAQRARQERIDTEKATEGAIAHYRQSRPLSGPHQYLEGKKLDVAGCGGLRVDAGGKLIIPMFIGDKLTSIQAITPEGDKRFWPGAKTGGAYYQIGSSDLLTVLCEGFATGLTIYQAIRNCRVIVAFNAGNLPRVAESIQRAGMGVVAADNDYETAKRIGINPGQQMGLEAATLLGVGMAIPSCSGTDWDDYRQERIEEIEEREAMKSRPMKAKDIAAKVCTEIAIAIKREARRIK